MRKVTIKKIANEIEKANKEQQEIAKAVDLTRVSITNEHSINALRLAEVFFANLNRRTVSDPRFMKILLFVVEEKIQECDYPSDFNTLINKKFKDILSLLSQVKKLGQYIPDESKETFKLIDSICDLTEGYASKAVANFVEISFCQDSSLANKARFYLKLALNINCALNQKRANISTAKEIEAKYYEENRIIIEEYLKVFPQDPNAQNHLTINSVNLILAYTALGKTDIVLSIINSSDKKDTKDLQIIHTFAKMLAFKEDQLKDLGIDIDINIKNLKNIENPLIRDLALGILYNTANKLFSIGETKSTLLILDYLEVDLYLDNKSNHQLMHFVQLTKGAILLFLRKDNLALEILTDLEENSENLRVKKFTPLYLGFYHHILALNEKSEESRSICHKFYDALHSRWNNLDGNFSSEDSLLYINIAKELKRLLAENIIGDFKVLLPQYEHY